MGEPWEEWEKEHGSGRDGEGDNREIASISHYVGDPVCAEYERFCQAGAELIGSLEDTGPIVSVERATITRLSAAAFEKWHERIGDLSDLFGPLPKKRPAQE